MTIKTVSIAEEYTKFPGGRYHNDGPGNGEGFREKFLVPALENNYKLKIVLDGAVGYPSSFLEEAFGGLVRKGYSESLINQNFEIVAESDEYEGYVDRIREFISLASQ